MSDVDERAGFHLLFMGAMQGRIRPCSKNRSNRLAQPSPSPADHLEEAAERRYSERERRDSNPRPPA